MTTMSSHQEGDSERLNFDEIDPLSNDFDQDETQSIYASSVSSAASEKIHMTKEERMDKLINDIGGLGKF